MYLKPWYTPFKIAHAWNVILVLRMEAMLRSWYLSSLEIPLLVKL